MDIQEAKELYTEIANNPPRRWNTEAALAFIAKEIHKGHGAAYIQRASIVPQEEGPSQFTDSEKATGIEALQELGYTATIDGIGYIRVEGWATKEGL
jgi:hypothetical protein